MCMEIPRSSPHAYTCTHINASHMHDTDTRTLAFYVRGSSKILFQNLSEFNKLEKQF